MPEKHVIPDEYKALGFSDEEIDLLLREYRGLGDMRHPKLAGKEHIIMIGSSTVDEVSGKTIDILYGIREQDAIRYAAEVSNHKDIKLELDNNGLDRYRPKGYTSANPSEALIVKSDFEQDYYNEMEIRRGEHKGR